MGSSAASTAPVGVILYDRPHTIRRVLRAVSAYRPDRLYLIADAPPETGGPAARRCQAARRAAEEAVTWPCEIHKLYADTHLGCRHRPTSGISALFEQEEAAILLEDDCLPSPSFFPFCAELLARYRDDPSIMMISGSNRLKHRPKDERDYFFSRFSQIWGWATWRRAWRKYDTALTDWPARKPDLERSTLPFEATRVLSAKLDEIAAGELDAWDFGWMYTLALENGLSVVPARNLVRNIGFGLRATHTLNPLAGLCQPGLRSIEPPYRGPETPSPDSVHDERYNRRVYGSAGRLHARERAHRIARALIRSG